MSEKLLKYLADFKGVLEKNNPGLAFMWFWGHYIWA